MFDVVLYSVLGTFYVLVVLSQMLVVILENRQPVKTVAWLMVLITGQQRGLRRLSRKNWLFLVLSGVTTGLSWLCYYRALQDGPASVVVPIDKLSIAITIAFSCLLLHEKLTRRAAMGLALILAGTGAMLL